ncbi:MAG: hypothetical protein RL616_1539 [Verrucomicrobiota bacterium]|jgi:hypothetical protein
MPTPVILYSANGVPEGARAIVQFKRPTYSDDPSPNYAAGVTKPKIADVIPFGGAGATSIGDPIVIAGLSISLNGESQKTTGTHGQSNNDPNLVRGNPTLNIETFITSNGMPTLLPGDFIEIYVGMKATSTAGAPVPIPGSRWLVNSNSIGTGGANKNSMSLELDRTNSDPTLAEF